MAPMNREQIYTDLRNAPALRAHRGPEQADRRPEKGIHPGRVVWVHNPEVAKWDGVTEPRAVKSAHRRMVGRRQLRSRPGRPHGLDRALQGLTGKKSDKEAWDAIFRHFNRTHLFGNAGYKPGEKITIKFNFNNDRPTKEGQPWPTGRGMPSPQVVHAVIKQLVEAAGIPGKDITMYDVADGRYISDPVYQRIRGEKNREYQDITFMVNPRTAEARPGGAFRRCRTRTNRSASRIPQWALRTSRFRWPRRKYRINCCLFRAHDRAGCHADGEEQLRGRSTGRTAENGRRRPTAIGRITGGPRPVHPVRIEDPRHGHVQRLRGPGRVQAPGRKGCALHHRRPLRSLRVRVQRDPVPVFSTTTGPASIFMSQDPIAIDSVGLDFIRNEPRCTPCGGLPDNFMHEAASAEKAAFRREVRPGAGRDGPFEPRRPRNTGTTPRRRSTPATWARRRESSCFP